MDSAAIQTAITNGEGITATVTADAAAKATAKLEAGLKGESNVALRFEQINAQTDVVEIVYEIHKAGVTPNGDAAMIGDEIISMPINIAVEQNDAYDAPMTIRDLR